MAACDPLVLSLCRKGIRDRAHPAVVEGEEDLQAAVAVMQVSKAENSPACGSSPF